MLYYIEEKNSTQSEEMPFMHSHEHYELYFALSGTRSYMTDKRLYDFSEGTLIVTAPFVLHKFSGGPFRRILISLNKSVLSPVQIRLLDRFAQSDVITLEKPVMEHICKILEDMLHVTDTPVKDAEIEFFLLLSQLFAIVYNQGKQSESKTEINESAPLRSVTPTILNVLAYLTDHYREPIKLDDLCAQFGISKTWLSECFVEATNMPVMRYKLTMQINEAKRLLLTTNHSIEQIAKDTGFSSVKYFGIIFKRYAGLPPKQYRKTTIGEK